MEWHHGMFKVFNEASVVNLIVKWLDQSMNLFIIPLLLLFSSNVAFLFSLAYMLIASRYFPCFIPVNTIFC